MKRILSALLGISVAATMTVGLTGCDWFGGSDTLTWICIGEKPADHDKVMEAANKIVEPELGLKLDIQYIDAASFTEKTKLMMSSGEPYDLVFTGYVNNYQAAVQMGGLLDITEMMENITMKDGTKVKMSDVVEDYFLKSAYVNGKIYGIPNTQVVSNPNTLQMEKRDADAVGFDYERLQELAVNNTNYETAVALADAYTEELAKLKANEGNGYQYTMKAFNPITLNIYEELAGGCVIRKDGTSDEVLIAAELDEFKLGWDTTRKWYELGYIRNDYASYAAMSSTDDDDQFAVTNTTYKPGQEQYFRNARGQDVEPAYAFFHEPYVGRTSALATMISVNAKAEHPEEAVKMIYMLNSNKELYNLICWGIEGEHYKINEDGTAVELEGSGYKDIAKNAWRYGNQFNGFVMEGQPADVWELTRKQNDEARVSPALGFVPDTSSISAEIANISSVNQEFKADKEYGVRPRSEWYDAYIAKLKAAGIEKVRDEIQKQYSAWKAEQK